MGVGGDLGHGRARGSLTVVVPVLIGDIKRGEGSDEIYTDFLASADDHVGLIARSQQLS